MLQPPSHFSHNPTSRIWRRELCDIPILFYCYNLQNNLFIFAAYRVWYMHKPTHTNSMFYQLRRSIVLSPFVRRFSEIVHMPDVTYVACILSCFQATYLYNYYSIRLNSYKFKYHAYVNFHGILPDYPCCIYRHVYFILFIYNDA